MAVPQEKLDTLIQNWDKLTWGDPIPGQPLVDAYKPEHFKIVCTGDGATGKSSLIMCIAGHPNGYMKGDEKGLSVSLWDTAGREDYDRLRPLSYPGAKCFFITFSVHNENSLENVAQKHAKEVQHHAPGIPIILVGCKSDLRNEMQERDRKFVVKEKAQQMADALKLSCYIECSSKTREGVMELITTAIKLGVQASITKPKKGSKCIMM